jgi:hypothetical protein
MRDPDESTQPHHSGVLHPQRMCEIINIGWFELISFEVIFKVVINNFCSRRC